MTDRFSDDSVDLKSLKEDGDRLERGTCLLMEQNGQ